VTHFSEDINNYIAYIVLVGRLLFYRWIFIGFILYALRSRTRTVLLYYRYIETFPKPRNPCHPKKEGGLFFGSKALRLVFSGNLSTGEFHQRRINSTPSAFSSLCSELRFSPLRSYENTAPFHQSPQKSPSSLREY